MKMTNQKGFTGLEIVAVLAIGYIITTAVLPVFGIHIGPGGVNKTEKQTSVTKIELAKDSDGKPIYATDSTGNAIPLFNKTECTANTTDEAAPKISIWQKLMNLGWVYLALCIAGIFIAPLGLIMGAINHKIGNEAHALLSHTGVIVKSVDAGLTEIEKAIKNAQSAYNGAQAAAAIATTPEAKIANQAIMATQQAIINTLTVLDRDVKDAMSMIQGSGSATEAVVTSLQTK